MIMLLKNPYGDKTKEYKVRISYSGPCFYFFRKILSITGIFDRNIEVLGTVVPILEKEPFPSTSKLP